MQSLAIEPICLGKSAVVMGHPKSGKTVAFVIGILNRISVSEHNTQALVLVPTGELAGIIADYFREIGRLMEGLTVSMFVGEHVLLARRRRDVGISVSVDEEEADKLPHIVVGTPGRVAKLIETGHLKCEHLKVMCLDDADKLLGGDLFSQTRRIVTHIPAEVQKLSFSATIPHDAYEFMGSNAICIRGTEKPTLDRVIQFYINVGTDCTSKLSTLTDIFGRVAIQMCVIFANSKDIVDYLKEYMEREGFMCSHIHSGMSQSEKDKRVQQFRTGADRVLICDDLPRGLDIEQVPVVINFEVPRSKEQYFNRVARYSRNGRKSIVISICEQREMREIREIERTFATSIKELPCDIERILKEDEDE